MRIPRITIRRLMITIAVIALDCYFVIEVFLGILLPILVLNIGLVPMGLSRARKRRFWVGFELTGLLLLVAYSACLMVVAEPFPFLHEPLASVGEYIPIRLAEALEMWIGSSSPSYVVPIFLIILIDEIVFGIPLLLLAVGGGLIAMWTGPRLISEPHLDEMPSVSHALEA